MTQANQPLRILVLDADLVVALTVTRSLVRQGYRVDVASARAAPLAAFSRRVNHCYTYPDPLRDAAAFIDWLAGHLREHHYDLVIPVSERSLVPMSAQRHRLGQTRIAMASAASLNRVLDKTETFRLAQSLQVPVPTSVTLDSIGQLAALEPQLTYPVVVKPSRSVAAGAAGYSKRSVSYATSAASLQRLCEQCLQHSPAILQSYFQGLGAGIELLASEGEILYAFQHIRLHEVPLTGGGSSFRKSAEIEPSLLAAATTLIRALAWTGVAMVEFKWNPDTGTFCLMEINGRFWGSLPLADAAGADFPAMLAELYLTGHLAAQPDYRRDIYCRNLASDLMWHEMVLRTRSDAVTTVPGVGQVLRDLARIFSPRHYFDTQSLRDPRPGLVEIGRLARAYSQRLWSVLTEQGFALRQRWLWRSGAVSRKLRAAETVLFVCYGNINRSVLAEVLMKTTLPPTCRKQILSAGLHREIARPADPRMQQIASEHGIDLSASRSRCVTPALLHSSDIIFVMEKRHRDALLAMEPGAAARIVLLGPGAQTPAHTVVEIADPYNQSESVYRSCFMQVQRAIATLSNGLQV